MAAARRNAKVIIVGCGIAGIAAAEKLLRFGFADLLIVEATGRAGGRIHSTNFEATWSQNDSFNEVAYRVDIYSKQPKDSDDVSQCGGVCGGVETNRENTETNPRDHGERERETHQLQNMQQQQQAPGSGSSPRTSCIPGEVVNISPPLLIGPVL